MKTYTEAQIKEFKKMGYEIDSKGNLVTATRLQKLVQQDVEQCNAVKLEKETRDSSRENSRKMAERFTPKNFRNYEVLSDEERAKIGLVTAKKVGIDYSLQKDNTKVCRCCQKRFESSYFYINTSAKDGLQGKCVSCESKYSSYYTNLTKTPKKVK